MPHIYFQRQYDWPWILVTIITNFTDISLPVSVTTASVQGMLGNLI